MRPAEVNFMMTCEVSFRFRSLGCS
jgi:hypothetical protein